MEGSMDEVKGGWTPRLPEAFKINLTSLQFVKVLFIIKGETDD